MIESSLFWLNSFALLFLLATSLVLLRNRIHLTGLPLDSQSAKSLPKISVCVPARNEEKNLATLLESAVTQNYSDFEIIVLDDNSTDRTPDIIESFASQYPEKVIRLEGKEKPADWLGKPWACHQLGMQASGQYLLFVDADTILAPDMLSGTINAFNKYDLDMFTVWPRQILVTFWEKTVIPLIYYALVTLLPAIYVYRSPRWLPSFFEKRFSSAFAAACGQCIAFKKEAYNKIDGHRSVKSEIVEDVELAKITKRAGLTMRMFQGVGTISCRMYRSEKEIFHGLRKNFLSGFGNSLPLFISAAILHVIVFLIPFFTIPYAIVTNNGPLLFLSVASVTLLLLHRLILAVWFKWNPIYSFTHPIGVVWFQRLGIVKLWDRITGNKVQWKGRNI